MAQLAFIIDIPTHKVAALPSFVVHGELVAQLVRKDGFDKAAFISAALTDLTLVPQAVNGDTYVPSTVSGSQTGARTFTPKRVLIVGGAAGNLTVTGIKTTHKLLAVLKILDAGQTFTDLTSEFTITASDTINNTGGTTTASSHVAVVYV